MCNSFSGKQKHSDENEFSIQHFRIERKRNSKIWKKSSKIDEIKFEKKKEYLNNKIEQKFSQLF